MPDMEIPERPFPFMHPILWHYRNISWRSVRGNEKCHHSAGQVSQVIIHRKDFGLGGFLSVLSA